MINKEERNHRAQEKLCETLHKEKNFLEERVKLVREYPELMNFIDFYHLVPNGKL